MAPAAHAQAPDDDDDDDDDDDTDDEGGDGIGDDDLGNDGAGDDGNDGDGDDGDDQSGADDDEGEDAGADDDDGPDGGDDDDGGQVGPGDGPAGRDDDQDDDDEDDDDKDVVKGGGGADETRKRSRDSDGNDAPGGAGVRGVSAGGDARIRDGDRDRGRAGQLPSGVDVDDQGRWVRAGEVLALESDRTGLALARAQGFVVQERIQLERLGIALVRLKAPAGKVLRNAVEELRALDQQNAYDYNHIYQLSQSATKPAAPRAGAGNPKRAPPPKPVVLPRGPTIGMIDGAVSAVHPALRGAAIEQRDFTRAGGAKAVDHGTAVASLLVGEDRPSFVGAAPGGRLLAGAVVDSGAANGALASADAMVRALDWTVAHGASVVNISLAGPPNELLAAAIQEAQKRGVVVVAAVGNDGPAAPPRYPAAYEGVIGVTAVDRAGSIYRRAGRGGHVDLAAYGVEVVAADPAKKYAPVTGTSFAAPQVAALIARTYAQPRPGGVQVVIEDLNRKARDRGEKGKDPIFGVGVIGVEGEP